MSELPTYDLVAAAAEMGFDLKVLAAEDFSEVWLLLVRRGTVHMKVRAAEAQKITDRIRTTLGPLTRWEWSGP